MVNNPPPFPPLLSPLINKDIVKTNHINAYQTDDLKSSLHRVELPPLTSRYTINNEGEKITQARYSIPYFCGPDLDRVIEVLDECVKEGEEKKYGPIVVGEYFKMRSMLAYET